MLSGIMKASWNPKNEVIWGWGMHYIYYTWLKQFIRCVFCYNFITFEYFLKTVFLYWIIWSLIFNLQIAAEFEQEPYPESQILTQAQVYKTSIN